MNYKKRDLLFASVAASALVFASLQAAHAQVVPGDPQCVVAGNVVTCTGDLQTGVAVVTPADAVVTLNVNNVDAPGIAPAASTDGINFTANVAQDIIINSDLTGTAGIATTGDSAEGIFALQAGGDGDVTVTSTGDITTTSSNAEGIFALQNAGAGAVTVTSTGDITTEGEDASGIYALQNAGSFVPTHHSTWETRVHSLRQWT